MKKKLYSKWFRGLSNILLYIFVMGILFSLFLTSKLYKENLLFSNSFEFYKTETVSNRLQSGINNIKNYIEAYLFSDDENLKQNNKEMLEQDVFKSDIKILVKNQDNKTIYSDIKQTNECKEIGTFFNEHYDYKNECYISYWFTVYLNNDLNKEGVFYDEYVNLKELYNSKNSILITGVVLFILAISIFIYKMMVAGYDKDGNLNLNWFDKISYEIILLGESFIFVFLIIGYNKRLSTLYYWGHIFISITVSYFLLLAIITTTIARLKNRSFIKNTFLSNILNKIIYLSNGLSGKKKAVAIILLYMGVDLFVFIIGVKFKISLFLFLIIVTKAVEILLLFNYMAMNEIIKKGLDSIKNGDKFTKIDTTKLSGGMKKQGILINELHSGMELAIEDKLKSERLKTELITNVSHDIKTPLTSIINYVDLIKKEKIENSKVVEYLEVVDRQSMRLKKLTEDLLEASKAVTGNILVQLKSIDISELIGQAIGEYEEKLEKINSTVIFTPIEKLFVMADGNLLWRVVDNVLSNICKYSLEDTRIYIDIEDDGDRVLVVYRNISKYQLNISEEELFERFVRGDKSRNINGNGLGLSIAKSLVNLQGGEIELKIDGDLFKTIIILKKE